MLGKEPGLLELSKHVVEGSAADRTWSQTRAVEGILPGALPGGYSTLALSDAEKVSALCPVQDSHDLGH